MPTAALTNAEISRGRTPVRRVLVAGEELDVTARTLKLDRTSGMHDQAALALSSPTMTSTDGLGDGPIVFSYGNAPRTEQFVGYVRTVAEEQTDNGQFSFTLNLLGATSAMVFGRQRFWSNKTVSSAVSHLVNFNDLGVRVAPHPHVWKSLVQTNDTDWRTMLTFAARVGYAVFNWNGVVLCANPVDLYYGNGPYLRLVSSADEATTDLFSGDRKLLEFKPSTGPEGAQAGVGVKFSYFDGDQVQTAVQSGRRFHRVVTDSPVRDSAEAAVFLEMIDRISTNWSQTATARIDGDASIYPGVNVDIVTSQREFKKKYEGKWLVLSVSHQMDNQSFQTMLTLGRPDHTVLSQVTAFSHFWVTDRRAKPTMTMVDYGVSETEALRRRWVSSWNDRRVGALV